LIFWQAFGKSKAMNFIESLYLACYFAFLATMIAVIQICAPGKHALTDEEIYEEIVEESESEEEFVMTENPLFEKEKEGLRHRNVEVTQICAPGKDALMDEEAHEEI
jgi:hypothetical protein